MLRTVFLTAVVLHGLIHLMGFAKAFGLAELPQLTQPITRPVGLLWLGAALLLLAAAVALPLWPRGWWWLGLLALLLSQGVILSSWKDARFGTLANLVLLAGIAYGFVSQGPFSLRHEFEGRRRQDPGEPAAVRLTEADLAPLPLPVQRYLRRAGVLGKPRVRAFRATWTGRIRGGPDQPWMPFRAEQLNTLEPPRRFFFMDATKLGLPVAVYHAFDEAGATMRVRVLSAFRLVDAKGAELTRAETVTLFNDLCILAPGALVSSRIAWEGGDDRTARATFTLGPHTIRAELRFNERDELVDFLSDDRLAGSPDGRTFTPLRWTTPLSAYAPMGPARVATRGQTIWHAPAGPYAYGEFELASLSYDGPR